MESSLLVVQSVQCTLSEGDIIFSNANFVVDEGDIVVVRARSGAGKTTLLKCLAHLNLYQGVVYYRGKTPRAHGVPVYRTLVQYIPQRPSLLPGTPRDLLHSVASLHSRAGKTHDLQAVLDIASSWDIDETLWDRAWNNLSGGEAQRLSLAIGFGLNTAEILLLDEPTSALDAEISQVVEDSLVQAVKSPESNLKAIVWITHSDEQAMRVGTRVIHLSSCGVHEGTLSRMNTPSGLSTPGSRRSTVEVQV